jgi:hypothetical protein
VAVPGQPQTSPSDRDGEVVRVLRKGRSSRGISLLYLVLAVALIAASAAYLLGTRTPRGKPPPAAVQAPLQSDVRPAAPAAASTDSVARTLRRPASPAPELLHEEPFEVPSLDPDDVAAHIRPGDPEPSAAELIEALHHAGIRSGIGAFNPPGTSPPLDGLVVPEDYDLPEGFVRHHQVTDEGEPLEPILLFSPDYEFFDAAGRPIPIPENRVVPPEHAPPDMPIPPVQPPPP